MALSKAVSSCGVSIPNCYIRVSQVTAKKGGKQVEVPRTAEEIAAGVPVTYTNQPVDILQFNVEYKASPSDDAFTKDYFKCEHDLLGGNCIKQAYLHLKTLPSFTGATDV